MEIVLIVASFILAIVGVVLMYIGSDIDKEHLMLIGVICEVLGLVCAIIISELEDPIPQAIDVYRGKTTLEITYRDSIPVDSVVVFKDK